MQPAVPSTRATGQRSSPKCARRLAQSETGPVVACLAGNLGLSPEASRGADMAVHGADASARRAAVTSTSRPIRSDYGMKRSTNIASPNE